MKTWSFKNYTIYDEQEVLRFENDNGDTIGFIAIHDEREQIINDLNNGVDPIEDNWEDGTGNIVNLNGWGNEND